MSLAATLAQIADAFNKQTEHTPCILFHPNSRYRSIFVAYLLNSPDYPVVYYAMGPDDVDLPSFLAGIINQVSSQSPLFGRHIHTLTDEEQQGAALVSAFARDLEEISSERFYLVFDEYDRSDIADDIQQFVEGLIQFLPPQCRLVINSRTLPRLPWISLIAQNSAAMLDDTHIVTRDFHGALQGEGDRLEIFALGPGFVLLNDEPIDTWEGHLPRLMFFFVLDRPVITRSEICQAFWPELDVDQAVNVFHVTKRRLHKALNMDVLVHDDGYYHINPHLNITYDVADFVSCLVQGRNGENAEHPTAWRDAVDLYGGPFLHGHEDSWIVNRRRSYRLGYLEALTHFAQQRLHEGRAEQALILTQRALQEDNNREDLHRQLLQLLGKLGRRSEVAAHYQQLAADAKRGKTQVGENIRSVYQGIMQE